MQLSRVLKCNSIFYLRISLGGSYFSKLHSFWPLHLPENIMIPTEILSILKLTHWNGYSNSQWLHLDQKFSMSFVYWLSWLRWGGGSGEWRWPVLWWWQSWGVRGRGQEDSQGLRKAETTRASNIDDPVRLFRHGVTITGTMHSGNLGRHISS